MPPAAVYYAATGIEPPSACGGALPANVVHRGPAKRGQWSGGAEVAASIAPGCRKGAVAREPEAPRPRAPPRPLGRPPGPCCAGFAPQRPGATARAGRGGDGSRPGQGAKASRVRTRRGGSSRRGVVPQTGSGAGHPPSLCENRKFAVPAGQGRSETGRGKT